MIETTTSDIVNVSTQAGQTLTDALNSIAVGPGGGGGLDPADRAKLDGIEPGATANAPDAQLRDRSTHTGTQLASTVSDFAAAVRSTTAAQLVAGANTTITQVGDTLVLASAAGSGPPSGAAGGVLGGTYPNPTFAADMATQAELDAVAAATNAALAGKEPTVAAGTSAQYYTGLKTWADFKSAMASLGGLTLASTLATSGAFAVTLTATAATNVTLPTAGTLATRAGAETLTNKTMNLAANTVTVDGTNLVGYRGLPQVAQSAAYTLVLTDAGKHILHPSADTTARTFTIPANASVAFPVGTAVTFVNQNGAGVITIAITTDTMRLAGAGTTGSRSLAANGVATAIKVTATEWLISGVGLT